VRTRKQKVSNLLILAVLLILVAVNSRSIANPLRMKFADILAGPLKGGNDTGSFFARLLPWHALREENARLTRENDLLTRKLAETLGLARENDRLKALLDFRKTVPFTTIPAQVIGRDPANWSDSIIIDKGSSSGVSEGRGVLSTRSLVGRVVQLGRRPAKTLLLTDPNVKVGVLVQRNGQGGVLTGRPDGTCKMIYIALDADVRPGDLVVTAGFGDIYPKGIVVGDVVSVGREPGRLYKYAIVRTAQDMAKLEEVLCIR